MSDLSLQLMEKEPRLPRPHDGVTYNNVYVVHYNFSDVDYFKAVDELHTLVQDLESVGLYTELRAGYDQSLLIFVKAPKELLGNMVYKSRVKDWLYGISLNHPGGGKDTVVDGDYEAEDLLSMYHLVTWSKELGGAGITPKSGNWENVESVFPLHNVSANRKLLQYLSRKIFLKPDDLDKIRGLFGVKVAFYFAFLQTYIVFMFFPASTGFLAWMFLPHYSLVYAIITSLWCVVFLEYWKLQEVDLSLRWNVRGIASLKMTRPKFKYIKEIVDPTTGELKRYFPIWKHVIRHTLQIPFTITALVILGALITLVFTIEIFISEVYEGTLKTYLEYLPTVLLACVLPFISSRFEDVATMLTNYENHRTQDRHEMSHTQKIFVLNFITNYLPILLTALVYVPFGNTIVPHLEILLRSVLPGTIKFESDGEFAVDPSRLRNEVIALTVTGQISNLFEELIFPYLKHKAGRWYKDYRAERAHVATINTVIRDIPEEVKFLKRARNEAQLEPYNVQDDYSEMIIQFGYLALFSPVWPLVSVGFLVNNWIELRSDFLKICIDHRRPAPIRTDGIGPWIDSLGFLTWMGSISTAAVVYLFGNDSLGFLPGSDTWYALPLTIFVSEHIYLVLRYIVGFALQRMVCSEQMRKRRKKRYVQRKKYLEELESRFQQHLAVDEQERERRRSVLLNGHDLFWTRQREPMASVDVGMGLIKALRSANEAKKEA
ncbi:Uu.00g125240.m01.CDS01 [Anthostomella pinea]|uniref:Uu.00g125240.m01.CDS01 n=1 Tax=Anthostomella pinea TaxID=933095 RepID=A0AAI8YHK4_9PEZI|nr:Uu.00g125240.m01.CDS01 [Anthostomella pinea]